MSGHAATFGTWYKVGSFQERIEPGAFRQTLRSKPDVVLTAQHAQALSGLPIARTTSGTLALREDDDGLAFAADLDEDDPDVIALRPKVARGDLSEMSFSFKVAGDAGQSWNADYSKRTLHAVDIDGGDVSICTRGANPSTSASIRSDAASVDERRELALEIGYEVRGFASGLAVAEKRAGKYDATALAKLGKAGKAMKGADGGCRYPVADREDLAAAVRAVGRGSGSHDAIRAFIYKRAAALGLMSMIPDNWKSDGSLRSAAAPRTDIERKARRLVAGKRDRQRQRYVDLIALRAELGAGRRS